MILIYLEKNTARSKYVFDFIFKEQFGVEYQLTKDIHVFKNAEKPKINYSAERLSYGFFIRNTGLLQDDSLRKIIVSVGESHGLKVLFPAEDCDLGFDLFAAVFYMLSRYEEYLPFQIDKFGRFSAAESIAFKNDFLDFPVIDAAMDLFGRKLGLGKRKTQFRPLMTYDIDVAYKFKGRSLGRNLGSMAKDIFNIRLANILQRCQTFLHIIKDPWDIYTDLINELSKNDLESIFFFLLGERSEYDRNLDHHSPILKQLIKSVGKETAIGIHPSFASNKRKKNVKAEKERLEYISGKKVYQSRQHFLKINFPNTYLNLIEAGITEDYSLGFHDQPGFRAGTCQPFYFYDLKNEEITNLRIFPVTCMEATFIYYEKAYPEIALTKILDLMSTVYDYKGIFISIWHNDNLEANGKRGGWKEVHKKMLQQARFFLNK